MESPSLNEATKPTIYWGDRLALKICLLGTLIIWLLALSNLVIALMRH